jgi:predicted cupin superfamily sugar epimerase
MKPDEIIRLLGLEPHPKEGGYFREIYRSNGNIATPGGPRAYSTAIYFMLTKDTFSAMHRLCSDEIFHLYMGGPVEMLNIYPDGSGGIVRIGHNLAGGERPQVIVSAGVWQGSRLAEGAEFALMGTTVAPGFDYADYEDGTRDGLCREYPEFKEMIEKLCLK